MSPNKLDRLWINSHNKQAKIFVAKVCAPFMYALGAVDRACQNAEW